MFSVKGVQLPNMAASEAGRTSMMGVEMVLEWLMISLMRGTPRVMFMLATPAKWNVLSVIWVPGSPMLCAPKAPTVEPAQACCQSSSALEGTGCK